MMRKFIFVFMFFTLISVSAQKKKGNILLSDSIPEIEDFLKTVHPDDPRRMMMKKRLITLKNTTWMKSGANQIPIKQAVQLTPEEMMGNQNQSVQSNQNDIDESDEFKKLMAEESTEKTQNVVKLFNVLFNTNDELGEVILMVQNKSDCDIIIRIHGKSYYNLAIPAQGEKFLIVKKDEYQLTSNVCKIKYSSTKIIDKHLQVMLDQPVIVHQDKYVDKGNARTTQ